MTEKPQFRALDTPLGLVKSSYEQLGITCGLPSPVESERPLLDFSSEAYFSPLAGDALSRTATSSNRTPGRGEADMSSRHSHGAVDVRRYNPSSDGSITASESIHQEQTASIQTAVIACYDEEGVAPRIEAVPFADAASYIDVVSLAVMNCVADLKGKLTPEIVYELVSNLVHANFSQPVISVLDSGDTIRVADRGPGIPNKPAAMRQGFTSASSAQRDVIRGVGAGLPLVQSLVEPVGGFLVIDDNIGGGAVVTASVNEQSPHRYTPLSPTTSVGSAPDVRAGVGPTPTQRPTHKSPSLTDIPIVEPHQGDPSPAVSQKSSPTPPLGGAPTSLITSSSATVRGVPLSARQREVLAVVADSLEAGPSTVSTLLDIPLSTAYRDLKFLEDRGLVSSLGSGKRQVTGMGMELLRVF